MRSFPSVVAASLLLVACVHAGNPKAAQTGTASWYGAESGRHTASGDAYNPTTLTCAHRSLPMGTMVKVTNLRNQKSVVVRVNDRGPYAKGRIVDINKPAARELDMIASGTAKVSLEVLASN